MSSLPSIEPSAAENVSSDKGQEYAPRSVDQVDQRVDRLVHLDEPVSMVSESPTIIKSRSLTKKIRERQGRDNGATASADGDKSIPAIHASNKTGTTTRESPAAEDGIVGIADNGLFTSSGKHTTPSMISTPNRTRASSIGNHSILDNGSHEVGMPSLPLHILKPAHPSSDSLQDVAIEHSKRNIDSPAPIGGGTPPHNSAIKVPSHTPGTGGAMTNAAVPSPRVTAPKALEKIQFAELGGQPQPQSGRQQQQQQHQHHGGHGRTGSGGIAGGAVSSTGSGATPGSTRLSALTHSPSVSATKTRASSGSASTMMAVHGLQPAAALLPDRHQERQYLAALEVNHKPVSSLTTEEAIDRVVQERLMEAKAMDRKNSSGAVMHQFSLWNKVSPATAPVAASSAAPAAALRSQSDSTSSHATLAPVTGLGFGQGGLSVTLPTTTAGAGADEARLSPKANQKGKLASLGPVTGSSPSTQSAFSHSASQVPAPTETASQPQSQPQPARRASKLRGPKAAREAHSSSFAVTEDEPLEGLVPASSVTAPTSAVGTPAQARSRGCSRDVLDDEYTLEFEPLSAFGTLAGDAVKGTATGHVDPFHGSGNSSLAAALRKKVGGAKMLSASIEGVSPEGGVLEGKQPDNTADIYTTPEKKQGGVGGAYAERQDPLEESDGGWYSDEFDEDDVDEAARLAHAGAEGRAQSVEPGAILNEAAAAAAATAAVIKSMSRSGPAAFGLQKVSSSLNATNVGLLETSSDKIRTGAQTERSDRTNGRRATTTATYSALGGVSAVTGGAAELSLADTVKSMTSRSASECHISFEPSAGNRTTTAKGGSSSKYQTLKILKSNKSLTQQSVSEKVHGGDQGSEAKVTSEKVSAELFPTSSAVTAAHMSDAQGQSPGSARSRDDAGSPTLSEASDLDEPTNAPTHRSPLRIDLDANGYNRDRAASEHHLSGVASGFGGDTHEPEESPLRWRKGEVIGEGTFGKVYKGMNEKTGELLAIKQLCLVDGTSGEVDSLRKEISVMWDLEHENIVRYLGTSKTDRYLFIILEYVTGGSIAGMINQFGAFNEKLIRRFSLHIVTGVEYLHSKGIIHRDIKGANILVSGSGVAKLADFGCSKQLAGMCTASIEESLKAIRGSVPWMAPEVIKQSGHGRSSDIWSVGATVIEMATGKPPWPEFSNNLAALFHVATSKTPPPMPPDASPLLCDFLSRCLVIEPAERASAHQLLTECEFLSSAVTTAAAGPAVGTASPLSSLHSNSNVSTGLGSAVPPLSVTSAPGPGPVPAVTTRPRADSTASNSTPRLP